MFAFWQRLFVFLSAWLRWNKVIPSGRIIPYETEIWMEDLRDRWEVNGMTVAVVTSPDYEFGDGEWKSHVMSFGTADSGSRPVTSETVWSLPSTSKFIATLALSHLIDSNVTLKNGELLQWDSYLNDIVHWSPEIPPGHENDTHIDLCNITLWELGTEVGRPHPRDTPFVQLSQIIHEVTGVAYEDYVREHILEPMQLGDALHGQRYSRIQDFRVDGFIREGVDVRRCAEDVKKDEDHSIQHRSCLGTAMNTGWWSDRYRGWNENYEHYLAGAMGLSLSGNDITNVLRAVLDKNSNIPRLVSLEPGNAFARSWMNESESQGGVSFGFGLYYPIYHEGKLMIDHLGSMAGQTSMMTWMPDHDFAIMVAMNEGYYGDDLAQTISFRLVQEILHIGQGDWENSIVSSIGWDLDKTALPEAPTPPTNSLLDTFYHNEFGKMQSKPLFPLESFESERATDQDRIHRHIVRALSEQTKHTLNTKASMAIGSVREQIVFDYIVFTHWDSDRWNWTGVNVWDFHKDEGHHRTAEATFHATKVPRPLSKSSERVKPRFLRKESNFTGVGGLHVGRNTSRIRNGDGR